MIQRIRFPSTIDRALCSALALVALCGLATTEPAAAAEVSVERLTRGKAFAPRWPGGTIERGDDSGMSWMRSLTDGKGGATFFTNVQPYVPAIDFRRKFVKVWVKVDDVSRLAGLELRLSSDRFKSSYFAFRIMLFDDPDFNVLRSGSWTPLTFGFGNARVEGNPDRSRIDSIGWYVADRGNEQPVTTWWGGLSLVDEPLQGVVSFTFDDGYDEHLLAAQIMAEAGFAGTAYVIPEAVGRDGYMSLHDLVDLKDSYGWDVAAHHQTPFTEFTSEQLENTILGVKRFLVENEFEGGAGHLAYPLGKQDLDVVRPLVRKHFTTARVAGGGPETLPPADPHLLRVVNVTNTTTPEEVGAAARAAMRNRQWLILMLHYLVEQPKTALDYSVEDFRKLVAEVKKSGVRVMPMARVWRACGLPDPDTGSACAFDETVPAAREAR